MNVLFFTKLIILINQITNDILLHVTWSPIVRALKHTAYQWSPQETKFTFYLAECSFHQNIT